MNRLVIGVILSVCFMKNAFCLNCPDNMTFDPITDSCIRSDCNGKCTVYFVLNEEDSYDVSVKPNKDAKGDIVLSNGISYWSEAGQNVRNLTIEEGITGVQASFYNTSLKSVTIADSVTEIKDGAFQSCSQLTTAVIGDSVETIPYVAFVNTALKSVVFGNSVTSISPDAFHPVATARGQNQFVIYCKNISSQTCSDMVYRDIPLYRGQIQVYTNEDGMYIIKDAENNTTYFASAANMASNTPCNNTNTAEGLDTCRAQALQSNGKFCKNLQECEKIVDQAKLGNIIFNGKSYASINDLTTGNYIKKRIYTVEEAAAVTKPLGNTFSIRYR